MNRAASRLRGLATVLLAVAVVSGAVELGARDERVAVAAPAQPRYYADGEMPEYPGSLEYPIGESMAINGVPVRLSHFNTKDGLDAVRDFYVRELKRMDVEPEVVTSPDGGLTVAGLSADGSGHIVISMTPRATGTDVFPAFFPLTGPLEPVMADDELPLSRKAVGVMKVRNRGGGAGDSVTYQEPGLSVDDASQHIRNVMKAKGWNEGQVSNKVGVKKSSILEFNRGGRTAHFTLTGYEHAEAGVAVFAQFSAGEEEP